MSDRLPPLELKPVPEYDKLSSAQAGPLPPLGIEKPSLAGTHGSGRGDGGGGSGAVGQSSFTHGMSRYSRTASSRQMGGGNLGRTSVMMKLQQSGRHLIDLGKLQARWLSTTLAKKSEAQDYVNEEDQGFWALLARHVDVPSSAWTRLGNPDGQFWQTGYATARGDAARRSLLPGAPDAQREAHAAEEGQAHEPAERDPRRSVFGLPVVNPYNKLAISWTMAILLLDLTYTAFWVPINVAFCTSEYGHLHSGCTSSDLVGGVLYFMNVLFSFQIGVVATHGYRKRTIVDGRVVAWLYGRYGRFWLDFVASVPFVYLVVVLAGRGHFKLDKGWVNCLSLLRLLRMVRLLSITKMVYMDSLSGRFQDSWIARWMSVTVVYSLFLAYLLAVAINLFACIMVLCAYFEGFDNSWMTAVSWANLTTASPVYQWYCAVYWMIVTATTTGFGDFQPRSLAEQVVANVAMIGGMIMFGVLVASIGNALSRATAEAHQAYLSRRKIMHVMDWAEHRQLPSDMQKQVQDFYAAKYGRQEEDAMDASVMAELPSRLRAKVARSMCVPLIADVHMLQYLQEDIQALLAENMRPLRLPAGEDLCQQGDDAGCFWILHEGIVEAVRYKEGKVVIDASETPRLLGESVLMGGSIEACRARLWTLRTVTPCRLWGITLHELHPLLRMYPVIALLAAAYVQEEVVSKAQREREGRGSAQHNPEDHFCEMAAIILKHLREHMTQEEAAEVVQGLTQVSAEDGTLQTLLEQLLQAVIARRGSVVAGHPAGEERQTAWGRGALGSQPSRGGTGGGEHDGSARAATLNGAAAPPAAAAGHPAAAGSNTVFGTPAAAATLTAALQGVGGSGPGPSAAGAELSMSPFLSGAGHAPSGPMGSGGGGGPVSCPGCQRCVCPSCGQGMDAGPTAAGAPAAPAPMAVLAAQSAISKPSAGPGVRSWANRTGTLRRVSLGARPDHVWAMDRKSTDRRNLGVMSIIPTYE